MLVYFGMGLAARTKRDFLWWGSSTKCVDTEDSDCSDKQKVKYLR